MLWTMEACGSAEAGDVGGAQRQSVGETKTPGSMIEEDDTRSINGKRVALPKQIQKGNRSAEKGLSKVDDIGRHAFVEPKLW
jgi:hypothetical protein